MYNLKYCGNCSKEKPLTEFTKSRAEADGHSYYCRMCKATIRHKYDYSEKGWMQKTFNRMKDLSKKRDHEFTLSGQDFITWISNTNFKEMHDAWNESGRDTGLKPSIDRLDDTLGYSIDNIQLITWKENNDKQDARRRKGLDSTSITVSQYDLEGNFIKKYVSACEAERQTGIRHIHSCRSGKQKTAGKYIWI